MEWSGVEWYVLELERQALLMAAVREECTKHTTLMHHTQHDLSSVSRSAFKVCYNPASFSFLCSPAST